MTDFLTSVLHLTEDQRSTLRKHDLDSAESIIAFGPETLATTAGLTLGSAGKLHTAARRAIESMPNADDAHRAKHTARRAALEAVAENPQPHRVEAAARLGIRYAVLVNDKPNVEMSISLMTDLEHGAPVPQLWQGHRVIAIESLVAPSVLWHPRTGKPLQAGKDDLTGIAWAELGIDTLRLLTYGYNIDAFHGMTDQAVFDQGKMAAAEMSPMLANLKRRAAAEGINLERIDDTDRHPSVGSYVAPSPIGPRKPAASNVGSPTARLSQLLRDLFSTDELRRFVVYKYGSDVAANLPGVNVSATAYADATADLLRRGGYVTHDLRDLLVLERRNRIAEIDAFFNSVL